MKIRIYWKEHEGISQQNGEQYVSMRELKRRIVQGKDYDGIEVGWEGVVPVNIFLDMQRRKEKLEKLIK